ncbi:MAG: hypothetical protein RLN90_04860 [Balneolaceae bacterium]
MKLVVFVSLIFVFFANSCDVLEVAEFPDYPVKIESLEMDALVALNQKYADENSNHICSTLNEFGFTGFSRILFPNDENPCLNREIVRSQLDYSDSLLIAAKSSLLKNVEYTNVTDTSALEVIEIIPLYGCTICEGPDENSVPLEYKISFNIQKFGATEVRNSELTVFVDSIGVNRIWGNWFPEFKSPGFINVGYLEAQKILVGWEIDMNPITGEDVNFTVQEEHVQETPIFEYMPFINEQTLELRRTWRVSISYKDDSYDGWFANVDVIDGLLLSVVPKTDEE